MHPTPETTQVPGRKLPAPCTSCALNNTNPPTLHHKRTHPSPGYHHCATQKVLELFLRQLTAPRFMCVMKHIECRFLAKDSVRDVELQRQAAVSFADRRLEARHDLDAREYTEKNKKVSDLGSPVNFNNAYM